MSLIEIIEMIVIQTLFCLGLRTVMSEGQIFYFIRKPFNEAKRINPIVTWVLKPIILCVICFSSFWGVSVFIFLYPIQVAPLIICSISTAFLIRVINDKVDW